MNVLVLGSEGLIGNALLQNLKFNTAGLEFSPKQSLVEKKAVLEGVIRAEKPNVIINCIGSFSNIFFRDLEVNAILSEMILETINASNFNIQTFLIGSAAEYGNIDGPVSEDERLEPSSMYGLSKKIQFEICEFYRKKYKMKINYLRPFNIAGHTLNRNLLIGEINFQLQQNKESNSKKFNFGDLSGYRDYLDIKKFAYIIERLIETEIEDYTLNIASGKGIEVREFVKQTIEKNGIINPEINEKKAVSDKSYKSVLADVTKLKKLIGEI